MKKFSFLFAALFAAMTLFAGSYTITFKEGTTTSDSSTKISTLSEIVADGAEYLSEITDASNVYLAREGRGLKLGTSKAIGSFTMTLAKSVKPTSIVISARRYNDKGENGTVLQDSTFTCAAEGDFADYTYVYDGNTEVSSILVASVNFRNYVKSVTVNFEGDAPAPIVAPYCATEVGHLFEETANPDSYVLLSIGAKDGKTIVRVDQDAAKKFFDNYKEI